MKKAGWIIGIIVLAVCGLGGLTMVQMRAKAAAAEKAKAGAPYTVATGDLLVQVIETGTLEAVKTVEVKSRVGGRVAKLFVDEGAIVQAGDLIARIDPQETELRVKQDAAQLRGAQSQVQRYDLEIAKRRVTAQTNLARARSRVKQLKLELAAQPTLTSTSIAAAETAYNNAVKAHELLVNVTQANARTQSQAQFEEAESNLANAKFELDRQRTLYDKGYISRRELESAELAHQLAVTRHRSAKESLGRIESEQAIERQRSQEQVRAAKADLDRARTNRFQDTVKKEEYDRALADLRDAEVDLRDIDILIANRRQQLASVDQLQSVLGDSVRQLGETEIRAPLTGIVSKRLVQEGELVSSLGSFSAGTPIVRIEDRGSMLVKLNVNEIDVAKLKIGQTASIVVDAITGKTFDGKVTKIAPAKVDDAAQTADPVVKYAVEVQLNSADGRLKSGMSAKCTMKVVDLRKVVRIPLEYLGNDAQGSFVMVAAADAKGKPTRTPVTVGEKTGSMAQILSGASEGTKLVKPDYTGPTRKGFMQAGPDEE